MLSITYYISQNGQYSTVYIVLCVCTVSHGAMYSNSISTVITERKIRYDFNISFMTHHLTELPILVTFLPHIGFKKAINQDIKWMPVDKSNQAVWPDQNRLAPYCGQKAFSLLMTLHLFDQKLVIFCQDIIH